jgi:hypothetical protein
MPWMFEYFIIMKLGGCAKKVGSLIRVDVPGTGPWERSTNRTVRYPKQTFTFILPSLPSSGQIPKLDFKPRSLPTGINLVFIYSSPDWDVTTRVHKIPRTYVVNFVCRYTDNHILIQNKFTSWLTKWILVMALDGDVPRNRRLIKKIPPTS